MSKGRYVYRGYEVFNAVEYTGYTCWNVTPQGEYNPVDAFNTKRDAMHAIDEWEGQNMFLVFITHKWYEVDEVQCDLDDHLSYLRRYDGTPDMWGKVDSLRDAVEACDKLHCNVTIVSDCGDYKIIDTISCIE